MRRIAVGLVSTIALMLLALPAVSQAQTVRASITWQELDDIDLHVYDSDGLHAYFGDLDAIPNALLSTDETDSGTETFTDNDVPSNRGFGYRVCYFSGSVPTEVTLTLTAPASAAGVRPRRRSRSTARASATAPACCRRSPPTRTGMATGCSTRPTTAPPT